MPRCRGSTVAASAIAICRRVQATRVGNDRCAAVSPAARPSSAPRMLRRGEAQLQHDQRPGAGVPAPGDPERVAGEEDPEADLAPVLVRRGDEPGGEDGDGHRRPLNEIEPVHGDSPAGGDPGSSVLLPIVEAHRPGLKFAPPLTPTLAADRHDDEEPRCALPRPCRRDARRCSLAGCAAPPPERSACARARSPRRRRSLRRPRRPRRRRWSRRRSPTPSHAPASACCRTRRPRSAAARASWSSIRSSTPAPASRPTAPCRWAPSSPA